MSFTILQDTPTTIPLAEYAKGTGWTIEDGVAKHEACNDGSIAVKGSIVSPVSNQSYTVAYEVSNLTSGSIRLRIGSTQGVLRTANGQYVETLVAGGINPKVSFFATGAMWLRTIDIKSAVLNEATKKRNTIVFSENTGKWTTFLSFTSDYGLSLFKDLFTFKAGKMYRHDPTLPTRNNIYGIQYKTIFNFVGNAGIGQPKTFLALSYEANELMVTTAEGITTSINQISELIDIDFLKANLNDGITQIDVFSVEGVYSSSFLRDMSNEGDLINGDVLKGSWITIELIQANNNLLKLKNVTIHSEPSKIGSR